MSDKSRSEFFIFSVGSALIVSISLLAHRFKKNKLALPVTTPPPNSPPATTPPATTPPATTLPATTNGILPEGVYESFLDQGVRVYLVPLTFFPLTKTFPSVQEGVAVYLGNTSYFLDQGFIQNPVESSDFVNALKKIKASGEAIRLLVPSGVSTTLTNFFKDLLSELEISYSLVPTVDIAIGGNYSKPETGYYADAGSLSAWLDQKLGRNVWSKSN